MSMSKDRVRFQIHLGMWQKGPGGYHQLLAACFGLHKGSYDAPLSGRPLQLVCRLSQFARFIINRNTLIQRGTIQGVNTIAEMKPELFLPMPETPREIDVSGN